MTEQNEVWRGVVGYESFFQVSIFGEVFSLRTNKILKQHTKKNGYKTIATKLGGRQSKCLCFKVHRLVAEAFIPNPENKPVVNHIDGDPGNNNCTNLEWCTISENTLHAIRLGLTDLSNLLSKNIQRRKLSREQVLLIRENFKLPKFERKSARELAELFGVNKTTILDIKCNYTYKDVV